MIKFFINRNEDFYRKIHFPKKYMNLKFYQTNVHVVDSSCYYFSHFLIILYCTIQGVADNYRYNFSGSFDSLTKKYYKGKLIIIYIKKYKKFQNLLLFDKKSRS